MPDPRRLTTDEGGHAVSALVEELTACLDAFEREMLADVHGLDKAGVLLSALSSVFVRTAHVIAHDQRAKTAFLERVSSDWDLFLRG